MTQWFHTVMTTVVVKATNWEKKYKAFRRLSSNSDEQKLQRMQTLNGNDGKSRISKLRGRGRELSDS